MDIGHKYSEPPAIDYRKLSAGLEHYESLGYQYREVPWVVSRQAMDVTRPPESPATSVQYGNLVASGEQSFIELMQRGEAILKACCITPCFRIEKSYDELHHPYFMKLELLHTHATDENLQKMLYDARDFFQKYTDVQIKKIKPATYDIIDRQQKIELGSYGIRSLNNQEFIYGTGVALPRLDTVLKNMR